MRSKEELRQRQDKLLSVYQEVQQELSKIPGVEGVGLGLKEVEGNLTDEISFRVYVSEKKERLNLQPEHIIPSEIKGFKTDVIKVYGSQEQVFVDKKDFTEHETLVGGIAISNEKASAGGTLGWFGTRVSDNAPILLSNEHVLYPHPEHLLGDRFPKDGDKIAQPIYQKKSCCESNVIANNITSENNGKVDCAIAKLNDSKKVVLVLTNKASSKVINVKGQDKAIVGVQVKKIGARSGFTTGIVADIGVVAIPNEKITLPDGSVVEKRKDLIMIRPIDTETYEIESGQKAFSNTGDSGSVILDVEDKIVGLLTSTVRDFPWLTLANHIDNVLAALEAKGHKIKLAMSPGSGNSSGVFVSHKRREYRYKSEEYPLLERLAQTELGDILIPLIARHRVEVLNLVSHCRPVTVAWQRHQGPAFFAHFLNSSRQADYQIPHEVIGISRQTLLLRMVTILREQGTESLKSDIEKYALDLINYAIELNSVEKLISKFDNRVTA